MKREEWARLEEACYAALDLPESSRATFLDEAFGAETELRDRAERLMASLSVEDAFLDDPLVRISDETGAGESVERTIGPYRLVRPLGSGGMGEVFLARQEGEGFERPVALKLIRSGMDSEGVLRRSRVERRILAGLDHPGIAGFLDAGVTEDDRPYLVMEFVEGVRIDTWCDREDATIERRLRLIQGVCAAVQHAHQKLVLHRDLKPSNVLVTDEGTVKLLDFGIGKVLDPDGAVEADHETRTETRMLTPEYASPEQIEGTSVSTASDVYSLGVLAYELLSGYHPYAGTGRTRFDLQRLVLEGEPARPSDRVATGEARPGGESTPSRTQSTDSRRLRRRLEGDLDNIVLKALRREPERRYASAAALAEDIQRHLDGLPVTARPDTFGYRAGKFVRRNRASVVAAALAGVTLIGAAGWTAIQNQRVRAESLRVAAERDKALAVQGFLMETFGAVGSSTSEGDEVAARALLDAQREALAGYEDRPELLAEMKHVLAEGYERLGFAEDGVGLVREALAWRQSTLGPASLDAARSRTLLGWIERQRGNREEAERLLVTAAEALRGHGPEGATALSRALNDLGVVLSDQARHDEAEVALREALTLRAGSVGEHDRSYGITANNLAAALAQQGEMAEAADYMDRAASALEAGLGPDHARVWFAKSNRAALRAYSGYTSELVEERREILADARRIFGDADPNTSRAIVELARAIRLTPLTASTDTLARLTEPEVLLREALAAREGRLGATHPDVIDTRNELAATLRALGRPQAAVTELRATIALSEEAYGARHPRTGIAWSRLGDALESAGDPEQALESHLEGASILVAALGDEHRETAFQQLKAGRLFVMLDRPREGIDLLERAERAVLAALPDGHRGRLSARTQLAEAYLVTGRTMLADSVLRAARADWEMDGSLDSDRLIRLEARVSEAR